MEYKTPIMLFCDHCGEENPKKQMCNFEAIPFEVTSANIGESASVCLPCFIKKEQEFTAEKEKEELKMLQYFYRNIVDIMNCGENQRHTIPYIYELIDEVKNILKKPTTKKAK